MHLFSNEVCYFLNNLDNYLPLLLNSKTLNIIIKNVIVDINGLVLTGNEYGILNRIAQLVVKSMFDVETLFISNCYYNPNKETDGSYLLSSYHMEFDLNEKALEYIKSIISNRNISQRQFVFIIKNAEPTINRHIYLALRRLIDINPNAKFIITTTSTSFMEKSLLSRLLILNCHFPFNNILKTDIVDQNTKSINELESIYTISNNNIITFLQNLSNDCKSLLWQQTCDKLLTIVTQEKKQLNIIMSIREHVYKLFHIGVPLKDICKYVIQTYSNHIEITNIVKIASECEHGILQGSKELLYYEKLFLELYKYIRP
jgi:hypothetical protein